MASAYPIAAFLIFALIGVFVFPIAWWLLAYWQKRKRLKRLSSASLYWSITPIIAFGFLYLGKEGILVPPMVSGIIFFVTPAVNIVALMVAMIMTIIKQGEPENESR